MMMTMELVGAAEIADLLGVTRQRVHQLTAQADFPAPLAKLRAGAVWQLDDVERWARETGRLA